ncbi:MAG: hypothetical protein OEY94_07905 [Alphaproteobacteria bacterium]|nr:hypothetical protein [Alphaproteobacteria bacterium]
MFNTINNMRLEKVVKDNYSQSKNWEEDIDEVVLESCGLTDDPTGFRAKFHRQGMKSKFKESFDTFYIGASHLEKRYRRIIESGYTAPMTEQAIDLFKRKVGLAPQQAASQ